MSARTPTRPSKPMANTTQNRASRRRAQQRLLLKIGIGAVAVGAVLFGVFRAGHAKSSQVGGRFQVGQPAAGADAPAIRLASTSGGQFDLAAQHGKTVLLYFQEGVGCEPCWSQIRDIERNQSKFQAQGIDEIVSITANPMGALRQKVSDENLKTPVLSDPDLTVSKSYHANDFGMMGSGADGHSFILVGRDGKMRWRADYGGAPNYTMYVAPDQLLADMRSGPAGP